MAIKIIIVGVMRLGNQGIPKLPLFLEYVIFC